MTCCGAGACDGSRGNSWPQLLRFSQYADFSMLYARYGSRLQIGARLTCTDVLRGASRSFTGASGFKLDFESLGDSAPSAKNRTDAMCLRLREVVARFAAVQRWRLTCVPGEPGLVEFDANSELVFCFGEQRGRSKADAR